MQNISNDSDASTETGSATYSLIFRPIKKLRDELSKIQDGDHEKLKEIRQKITIEDYETIHLGRGTADLTDEEVYRKLVGDFDKAMFSQTNEKTDVTIGTPVSRYLSLTQEFSFS